MRCDQLREQFGAFVDGELDAAARTAIEAHLRDCDACRAELDRLRELTARIQGAGPDGVPPDLWDRIAERLDTRALPRRRRFLVRMRTVVAAAACLLVAVGGGYLLLQRGVELTPSASAATVDFSALLDGLALDAEQAFRTFVGQYQGRRVSADEARHHARQLNFALPPTLPGGFVVDEVFALRIGDNPAAAAIYRHGSEFVGVIFHRAIHPEDYGTYRDHECVVGEHRGHRVAVGEWHLVHVTDATTCHCVLSRLDEEKDLPPILDAVAPQLPAGDHHS